MITSIKKLFCLSVVALCTTLDLFAITEVVFGASVDKSSEYPVVSGINNDKPICYIQASNGSTLDLSNLCNSDPETQLSKIDRNFLNSYNNSLNSYQNERIVASPDSNTSPSPIEVARGVCNALKSKVSLEQIETDQYKKIIETEDPRNQKIALLQNNIIDSLAIKFYCPEFAK